MMFAFSVFAGTGFFSFRPVVAILRVVVASDDEAGLGVGRLQADIRRQTPQRFQK